MAQPATKVTRRGPQPKPARLRVTIPERVSPHVKLVFAEMQRQGVIYDDLAWKSGVQRAAIKGWRTKNTPMLTSLEAVLGVLGWDLVPIPRGEPMPSEIEAKLKPIAAELGISMAQTMRFLIEIVAGIRQRTGSAPPGGAVTYLPAAKRLRRGFVHPDQESLFNAAA